MNTLNKLMSLPQMINSSVSIFNISSKFVQTFVLSVNKFLNALHKERCWLLSEPLTNDWLHLSIWCKFLPN